MQESDDNFKSPKADVTIDFDASPRAGENTLPHIGAFRTRLVEVA
jgi:hypothetical protein